MKKLYIALTASLLSVGVAFAASGNVGLNHEITSKKSLQTTTVTKKAGKTAVINNATVASRSLDLNAAKSVKAIRKADSNPSIEGTWIFTMGDYYFQSSVGSMEITYEAEVSGTTVTFSDPTGYELPFQGTYNETNSTISFSRIYLGPSSGYYIYQAPYEYDYGIQDLVDIPALVGTYNPSTQTISFPTDCGLSWEAYTSQNASTLAGYFAIYDFEGAEKEPDWIAMENATFNENIIYPLFRQGTKNTVFAEVDVLQDPFNEGIFKVKNPFKTLYASAGLQGTSPDMIIDATDPGNVLVGLQTTGITGGAGIGVYYYFNEGWWSDQFNDPLDPALICTMTVDDDNVATITFPYRSFMVYAPDQGDDGQFYYASSYESILTFQLPQSDEGGDDEGGDDGEGVTYAASVSGTYTQNMGADNITDYPYTFDYAITYNSNKTLSVNGKFNWENETGPVGGSNSLGAIIPGVGVSNGTQGETFVLKPDGNTKTFEEGETVTITFQTAVANGNVEVQVNYVVGSINESTGGDDEGDITGNMIYQVDMNMGWEDEPDLTEFVDCDVTASYNEETHALTIYNFAEEEFPITFTINVAEGTAVASNQIALVEDYGDGDVFTYYYSDVESKTTNVYATVSPTDDGKTKLNVKPWGEGMDFGGDFGFFFNAAFYNTEVILDFTIDGLPEAVDAAAVVIGDIIEECHSDGAGRQYLILSVPVTCENLGDNPQVKVEYTWAEGEEPADESTDNRGTVTEANDEGYYVIQIGNLEPKSKYTVEIKATGYDAATGTTVSTTEVLTITAISTGIDSIEANEADAVYFDLNGRRVVNPANGIFVKVLSGKASKVVVNK